MLLDETETPHKKYWVPVRWAMAIIRQARSEGLVANDFAVQDMYKVLVFNIIFNNKTLTLNISFT